MPNVAIPLRVMLHHLPIFLPIPPPIVRKWKSAGSLNRTLSTVVWSRALAEEGKGPEGPTYKHDPHFRSNTTFCAGKQTPPNTTLRPRGPQSELPDRTLQRGLHKTWHNKPPFQASLEVSKHYHIETRDRATCYMQELMNPSHHQVFGNQI